MLVPLFVNKDVSITYCIIKLSIKLDAMYEAPLLFAGMAHVICKKQFVITYYELAAIKWIWEWSQNAHCDKFWLANRWKYL